MNNYNGNCINCSGEVFQLKKSNHKKCLNTEKKIISNKPSKPITLKKLTQ